MEVCETSLSEIKSQALQIIDENLKLDDLLKEIEENVSLKPLSIILRKKICVS